MTPRTVVTGGIGLLLCVPVVGTQVVAHQLRYAAWLGRPLLKLGRVGLYAPWNYGVWYWKHAWYYPAPFDWGLAAMVCWLIAGAVLVAIFLKRSGWQRRTVPQDVDWGGPREIRKAGLFVQIRK